MYEPSNDENAVGHLAALGYVDPLVEAAREATLRRELEADFQQALKHYEAGALQEAIRRFEVLALDDPEWIAPRQLLAESYYRAGGLTEAWQQLASQQLAWLTEHGVESPRLALIAGTIALVRREWHAAFYDLEYAAHVEPSLPNVHTLLGTVQLRIGQVGDAEGSFTLALEQNPADAAAFDGMAAVCIRRGEFEEAAGFALEALEHDMQLSRAHYHLGVALANMERHEESIAAFETAAKLNAKTAGPYRWMAKIAGQGLGDSDRAATYREAGRAIIRRRPRRSSRG